MLRQLLRISSIILVAFVITLVVVAASVRAQHDEAEPGYYPAAYVGDAWQGNVTAVDDQAETITSYVYKGSKSQTIVIGFAPGLAVTYSDGTSKELKPSDIPIGAMAYAYNRNYSEGVDGTKTDVHEAFMFRIKAVDGVEHHYKAPFDPTLKRWGQGGIQVMESADRPE